MTIWVGFWGDAVAEGIQPWPLWAPPDDRARPRPGRRAAVPDRGGTGGRPPTAVPRAAGWTAAQGGPGDGYPWPARRLQPGPPGPGDDRGGDPARPRGPDLAGRLHRRRLRAWLLLPRGSLHERVALAADQGHRRGDAGRDHPVRPDV